MNVGFLIKSSPLVETNFVGYYIRTPFVRAFVISFSVGRYLVTAEYVRPRPRSSTNVPPG